MSEAGFEERFVGEFHRWREKVEANANLSGDKLYHALIDHLWMVGRHNAALLDKYSERLIAHHHAAGVDNETCPVCLSIKARHRLVHSALNDEQSVYALVALAVAEYRKAFNAWPTALADGYYLQVDGAWDAPLNEAVLAKLSPIDHPGVDVEVVVSGVEGMCDHAASTVAFDSDEYRDAARWLYGDLWEPGIESNWLAGIAEPEDASRPEREGQTFTGESEGRV